MNNQPPDNQYSTQPSEPYPPQQPSGQYPPQYQPQTPGQYPPQQPSGQYPPQQYPPQQPSGQYPPQQYPPQQYPPHPSGQYPPQQYPQQASGQYPPQQFPPQRYDGPPQGYPQGPQGFPQTPQPPKKRGRGPLIAIGVIVAVLLVACIAAGVAAASYLGKTATTATTTTTTTTKTGPTTTSSGTTPTAGSTQSNHKVGDVVQVGTSWMATVDGVTTSTGNTYNAPKAGMRYLVITLTMKNLSSEKQVVSSIVQFTLRGDDGTKYEVTIYTDAGSIIDGNVDAGQTTKGVIVYEVPTNVNTFHLTFSSNPYDTNSPDTTWDLSV